MKHIGILAHSAEGATLCYRETWLEGVRRLGAHRHPEITLSGVAMAEALDDWERGDLAALRAFFLRDARKLAAAGADFFICPDNTAHIALEFEGEPFPIPCLHIGEVVADQAQREGRRKVGVLGNQMDNDRSRLSRCIRPARNRLGSTGRRGSQDDRRYYLS